MNAGLASRRLPWVVAAAWLPPAVAAAAAGALHGGASSGPFALDLATHARLLIALPLLLAGEPGLWRRLDATFRQFPRAGLVDEDEPRFVAVAHRFTRGRSSALVHGLLLAAAFAGAALAIGTRSTGVLGWAYAGGRLSVAGWWYAVVSLPLFQYLVARWLLALVLWWAALLALARAPLELSPTHPDATGGLGFLGDGALAFRVLALAAAVVLAASAARRILYEGATVASLKGPLILFGVIALAAPFAPLAAFAPRLRRTREHARRSLGLLGASYARQFDERWLSDPSHADAELLGHPSIQSLSDFINSHGVLRDLHLVPFSRRDVLEMVLAAALPILPVLALKIPLVELAKRLLQAVL